MGVSSRQKGRCAPQQHLRMPQPGGVASELWSNQRLAHTVARADPRELGLLMNEDEISTHSE